jgi:SpoIID/LytB domain protein
MKKELLQSFFEGQLSVWSDCAKRYDDLSKARRKAVDVGGRQYQLVFNPARMASAKAKVDNGKVDRPCFLCRDNRPEEQKDLRLKPPGSDFSYLLSVNPFPILPNHFTIINDGHCRQQMTLERLRDMAYMANELPGYLVFFNGAASGASAPDHFHFQAVPQRLVPLTGWSNREKLDLGVQVCCADDVKVDFSKSDNMNILCWNTPEGLCWWVIGRRKHRPEQYYAEGESQIIVSPASLEFAGVVPLPREEDFEKMDSALLTDILAQCQDAEPLVDVGIGKMDMDKTDNPDGTFTLDNVRIGIGFHWDQRRRFTYEGQLISRMNVEEDALWAVNRVPVERYLLSVISSEMSATSSLELLKAHAVVSRSWLMRQIRMKSPLYINKVGTAVSPGENSGAADEIVRWYDSHSHLSFDVCADDHCQRYQGISSKMNPVVAQAVEETRGEVLVYDGEVCDARFSKCCGGVTEEYKYCWENLDVPYLKSVPDTRNDGTAFCNTSDREVLRQVLNDYDQATADFYEWDVEYTQAQLSDLLERKLHLGVGTVEALEPLERGKSGRISRLKIVGSLRTVIIGKELEIRKGLSETHLYSSAFTVSTAVDGNGGTLFRLHGRGWGHGVGMCQIGAAVMGAEGYDYKTILSLYYKNAEIKKIW